MMSNKVGQLLRKMIDNMVKSGCLRIQYGGFLLLQSWAASSNAVPDTCLTDTLRRTSGRKDSNAAMHFKLDIGDNGSILEA